MASTYSDFDFYSAEYGGELDEDTWRVFAARGRDAIDYLTFGRAHAYLSDPLADGNAGPMRAKLARCECELADILHGLAGVPVGVVSVSNDGYAQNFGGAEDEILIWRACRKHLTAPVNLMLNGAAI